ncbi:hypothetical protein MtrunA17_Chr3g0122281 [Medicago truncatula]|uniref:Uncharacterized protein n=1 Tax=Medicago truncatula TaxID=3880 RepID=A0A396IXU7_MEDTR|nr:hypothetical protein MtrunA17_Chr3g0122281 [Medicago truncatula]
MDPSGGHSAAWVRKSLNILQFSLNRPSSLCCVDEDGDEEMEIDEEDVEDHVQVNFVSGNHNKMNIADQDLAQLTEKKNNPCGFQASIKDSFEVKLEQELNGLRQKAGGFLFLKN